jgi:GNAT superfamily N-acetyltransferase
LIAALSAGEIFARAGALAEVLLDAVAGGASVSFMADFSRTAAEEYFRAIAADVAEGRRVLFAAEVNAVHMPVGEVNSVHPAALDGTAQLVLDTPPNQPHRTELAKMLVHRRARRQGLGRALFQAVEAEALRRCRTLLTFDTIAGGAGERLYLSWGCVKVGEIPDYALMPDGTPAATSVFFKKLR